MKSNIKELVGVGAVIIVFAIAIAMILPSKNEKTAVVPKQESTLQAEFKTNFMIGCYDETNYAECDCAYDALLKEYGEAGLLSFALRYDNTGDFEERAVNAIMHCY